MELTKREKMLHVFTVLNGVNNCFHWYFSDVTCNLLSIYSSHELQEVRAFTIDFRQPYISYDQTTSLQGRSIDNTGNTIQSNQTARSKTKGE